MVPNTIVMQVPTVLEIVRVDAENNLLLVKGAVPGPKKSLVTIKATVKSAK